MKEDKEEAPATAASESSLTTPRPIENTDESTGEGEAGVPSADVESTARDAGTNAIDGGACPESPEHPFPPPGSKDRIAGAAGWRHKIWRAELERTPPQSHGR